MNDGVPRAAVGHMPFPGHRTQLTIRLQTEAAKRRRDAQIRRAKEYGYDPDSWKVKP